MNSEIPVNEYIARQMGELHIQLCIKSAQLDALRQENEMLKKALNVKEESEKK